LRELKAFVRGLRRLQGNLLRNESSELEQFLSHAKRRRDNWHPSVQNNSNP